VTGIDNGILLTNGIAFGRDGLLYVNETITRNLDRYGMEDGSVVGPRAPFGKVIRSNAPVSFKGPNGMAFSTDVKLHLAVFGQHDVVVPGKEGEVVVRIETAGSLPTDVAFALHGNKRIAVTKDDLGQLEIYGVPTDGPPLWSGERAPDLVANP
jgi:sugar lactone lactonase YvrE